MAIKKANVLCEYHVQNKSSNLYLKIQVFWDGTLCQLLNGLCCFQGLECHHLRGHSWAD